MSQPEGPQGQPDEAGQPADGVPPTPGPPGPPVPPPPQQPGPPGPPGPPPAAPPPPGPPPGAYAPVYQPPPNPAAGGYPAGGYPPAPMGQWQPGAYPPSPKTDTNAIVAFVLSLVAWAMCPVIPAIVALVLANKAEAAIRAGAPMVEGQGLVTATRWISWINIALWGLLLGFFLVLFLIAAATGS